MYVIIRGHCIEGENLEEMAACLLKSDPELFPIEMQSKDSPFREI